MHFLKHYRLRKCGRERQRSVDKNKENNSEELRVVM